MIKSLYRFFPQAVQVSCVLLCASYACAFDLNSLEKYVQTEGHETLLFVLQKDQKTVFRHSDPNLGTETLFLSWSMGKTFLNYLLFIAEDKKILNRNDSICEFLALSKESFTPQICEIKLEHLLSMTSGIRWSETYEEDISKSSVINMLYGEQVNDAVGFILSLGIEHPVGTIYRYSSGDSVLLAHVLKAAIEKNGMSWKEFWQQAIREFDPKNPPFVESDAKGNPLFSSFLYMSEKAYLSFANLLLDTKKVSREWLAWSRQSLPELNKSVPSEYDVNVPGKHVWTNNLNPEGRRAWPSLPEDTFAALGHWGNFLLIIPSEKIVILRIARDLKNVFEVEKMAKMLKLNGVGGKRFQTSQKKPNSLSLSTLLKLGWGMGFGAKMYCSCRYIQKLSSDYCKNFIDTGSVPKWLLRIRENSKESSVNAGYWPFQRQAKFNDGKGCLLD